MTHISKESAQRAESNEPSFNLLGAGMAKIMADFAVGGHEGFRGLVFFRDVFPKKDQTLRNKTVRICVPIPLVLLVRRIKEVRAWSSRTQN